ncbi:hypothetical protein [uncultured Metabacillus sp.]|uniref:hypothetical protein n=1 Tax=uncultured Metabacillus sp. TaxID=2860135 RepID=UPI00262E463B|nr:hypothetical protein [uncultured Metabacillus sp.]
MKQLLQGEVKLDFYCVIGGGNIEEAENKFHSLIDVDDLQVQGMLVRGSDGKLHMVGIEGGSELIINSIVGVDEDTPRKYLDYQVGRLVASKNTDL